jgi:hypothetical protein
LTSLGDENSDIYKSLTPNGLSLIYMYYDKDENGELQIFNTCSQCWVPLYKPLVVLNV